MKEKVFTIDNIYFIIAIAILTFWLTFVTAKGGLTNHNYTRQWWKRITNRGKITGFILIALPIVLVFQEVNNQRISHNGNIDLKKAQDSSAALITQGVKNGVKIETNKLFENLSTAFKKQGLQYDTIKNQVFKLRDSIRITEINREIPLILLSNLQIIDSTNFDKRYSVQYTIKSLEAKSLNVDLKFDVFCITQRSNIVTIERNIRILHKGQVIPKDYGLMNKVSLPKDNNLYATYVFRLKGTYYSSDKQAIFIDEFYLLKPQMKKEIAFSSASQVHEDFLRSYISSYKE